MESQRHNKIENLDVNLNYIYKIAYI